MALEHEDLTEETTAAAIEVCQQVGLGSVESTYENALVLSYATARQSRL